MRKAYFLLACQTVSIYTLPFELKAGKPDVPGDMRTEGSTRRVER
jgi:hypothetical protein